VWPLATSCVATCLCCVIEIVLVTAKCDFSPFDGLHLVELATRRRYSSRQLNVLLSSNAVLKGNIMIRNDNVDDCYDCCFYLTYYC